MVDALRGKNVFKRLIDLSSLLRTFSLGYDFKELFYEKTYISNYPLVLFLVSYSKLTGKSNAQSNYMGNKDLRNQNLGG